MKSDGGLCGVSYRSHALFMGVGPIMMSLAPDTIERR
jgi:hypothetical protein